MIGSVVSELWLATDRRTDRRTEPNLIAPSGALAPVGEGRGRDEAKTKKTNKNKIKKQTKTKNTIKIEAPLCIVIEF